MDMILNEKDSNDKIIDYFNRHEGVKYAYDTTTGFFRIYFDDNYNWDDFFITTVLLMNDKSRSEWIKHFNKEQQAQVIRKLL